MYLRGKSVGISGGFLTITPTSPAILTVLRTTVQHTHTCAHTLQASGVASPAWHVKSSCPLAVVTHPVLRDARAASPGILTGSLGLGGDTESDRTAPAARVLSEAVNGSTGFGRLNRTWSHTGLGPSGSCCWTFSPEAALYDAPASCLPWRQRDRVAPEGLEGSVRCRPSSSRPAPPSR